MLFMERILTDKAVLVTGAAGFIGFHVSMALLEAGFSVIGYDNVNDYYDESLKRARLSILDNYGEFRFTEADLCDNDTLSFIFAEHQFDYVVHLAAQAGVRYSLDNPRAYLQSNIEGFLNILELVRNYPPRHFLYASSSSVYGDMEVSKLFEEGDRTDTPISFYGATKKAGEAMAYSYARLYGVRMTGLRFFTVYGEWGRPDMALFLFTDAMLKGVPITLFNDGNMTRDFTYIGDVVEGILGVLGKVPCANEFGAASAIYNIGAGKPQNLHDVVLLLENELGVKAKICYAEQQQGDLTDTFASCELLHEAIGYKPETSLEAGVKKFCDWYKSYY